MLPALKDGACADGCLGISRATGEPELQDVGRPRFDKYWSSLGPITIVEPAKAVGRTVIVGFEIDFPDKGVVYFQRNELDMVVVDGKPMIDSMRRLSFERIEG